MRRNLPESKPERIPCGKEAGNPPGEVALASLRLSWPAF
jgi:hypothetical protein